MFANNRFSSCSELAAFYNQRTMSQPLGQSKELDHCKHLRSIVGLLDLLRCNLKSGIRCGSAGVHGGLQEHFLQVT